MNTITDKLNKLVERITNNNSICSKTKCSINELANVLKKDNLNNVSILEEINNLEKKLETKKICASDRKTIIKLIGKLIDHVNISQTDEPLINLDIIQTENVKQ